MSGHSHSKNGVASLGYVPAMLVFKLLGKLRETRNEPGRDPKS